MNLALFALFPGEFSSDGPSATMFPLPFMLRAAISFSSVSVALMSGFRFLLAILVKGVSRLFRGFPVLGVAGSLKMSSFGPGVSGAWGGLCFSSHSFTSGSFSVNKKKQHRSADSRSLGHTQTKRKCQCFRYYSWSEGFIHDFPLSGPALFTVRQEAR